MTRSRSISIAPSETGVSAGLDGVVAGLLAAAPPRAGSLAITLFGDVVSLQGGCVWLGSLVEVMAGFGLNARQVRTAVFRLARDGWLAAEQRGRRSFYRLTPFGQRHYARAATRIYAAADPAWDGEWTLVMPGALDTVTRDELRKRLGWLGYGALAAGVLAHPRADDAALADVLDELGLAERVVSWRARTANLDPLSDLAGAAWQLDEAAARLRVFIERFQPCADDLETGRIPSPSTAFQLRCLLIHEYRRILLRTPDLPAELLAVDWPGHAARELVAGLYRRLHAAASHHASAVLCDASGPLPPPDAAFLGRFGGLAEIARGSRNVRD
ncbi:MAG: phenylacetic acid degradation operon negative regulatory protein PaaX [Gammaproteobacteria bacterium]